MGEWWNGGMVEWWNAGIMGNTAPQTPWEREALHSLWRARLWRAVAPKASSFIILTSHFLLGGGDGRRDWEGGIFREVLLQHLGELHFKYGQGN